jgi:hypothetical protein
MARPINCDMGHDEQVPAAYLVTDLASGDVIALCSGCMVELGAGMVRGTGGTVTMPGQVEPVPESGPGPAPGIVDAPLPDPPDNAVMPDRLSDDTAENEAARAMDEHHARTRAKLAARPDAAATSETVVPWPQDSGRTVTLPGTLGGDDGADPREPDGDVTD